jgi:hypothetical protein
MVISTPQGAARFASWRDGRLHRSMQKFIVTGGQPLNGGVRIAGVR